MNTHPYAAAAVLVPRSARHGAARIAIIIGDQPSIALIGVPSRSQ